MLRNAAAALIAMAVPLLLQCVLPDPLPIVGAWSSSDVGVTETWVFTGSSVSITDRNGAQVTGTMSSAIQSVSVPQGHLQVVTTACAGLYAQVPVGSPWYITWSATPGELFVSGSFVAYPSTAATGPFIKIQ